MALDDSDSEDFASSASRSPLLGAAPCSSRALVGVCAAFAALSVGVGLLAGVRAGRRARRLPAPRSMISQAPPGVNVGGWLVLEDWFFSGPTGRHVMSTDPAGQGYCLPPLLQGSERPWPSEGILTKTLETTRGENETVEIFEAHRHSFVGDVDLQRMSDMGVSKLRVPIPWATFADTLADIDPVRLGHFRVRGSARACAAPCAPSPSGSSSEFAHVRISRGV